MKSILTMSVGAVFGAAVVIFLGAMALVNAETATEGTPYGVRINPGSRMEWIG